MSNPFNQAPGYQIGEQLAVNVLGASSAREAAQAIRRALLELRKLDHPKQSATGFVNALTAIFTDGQTPSETAICNGPSNIERESEHDGIHCPVCAESAIILNIERNHFAVCYECGIYFIFGSNLFSAWRDESPEVWEENRKALSGMTQYIFKPIAPPPVSSSDDDGILF
ncbi:hypothetical protein [Propionivibrio sp.]|uniref:hypothetical protein n=1 Tax=Propionivibrio sp. TaxID=2212460 RepID=UPI003BF04F61